MTAGQNVTLFLIDDDPVTNIINTRIITKNFAPNVIVFTNAQEALDRLKTWSPIETIRFPSIIFLDIDMPQMDGWDFLEEFQKLPTEAHEKCRVVMLTSSIDFSDIKKSKTYSTVHAFLSKPLSVQKLQELL